MQKAIEVHWINTDGEVEFKTFENWGNTSAEVQAKRFEYDKKLQGFETFVKEIQA